MTTETETETKKPRARPETIRRACILLYGARVETPCERSGRTAADCARALRAAVDRVVALGIPHRTALNLARLSRAELWRGFCDAHKECEI